MSGPTNQQVNGPLAAFLPLMTAALVGWGIDDYTAGLVAGGLVMLAAGGWSWWKGRPVAMAQSLVDRDVTLSIGKNAPADLQAAASDPAMPGFIPRVPPRTSGL